jgi:hypothetical protein
MRPEEDRGLDRPAASYSHSSPSSSAAGSATVEEEGDENDEKKTPAGQDSPFSNCLFFRFVI